MLLLRCSGMLRKFLDVLGCSCSRYQWLEGDAGTAERLSLSLLFLAANYRLKSIIYKLNLLNRILSIFNIQCPSHGEADDL